MTPQVSVIIACLNDLEHLPRAVDSVLSQTFAGLELIIADGASTDGTVDYLRGLQDARVHWRSERDGGLTEAWNKALAMAKGEWILFLGADDFIWDNDVLAKTAPFLKSTDAAFAFGEVRIVAQHSDTTVQRVCFDKPQLLAHLRSSKGLGLPHQGFFHNRRAFHTGLFDQTFRLAADYEFISRFSGEQDFHFLPVGPVTAFRMGGLSTDPWVSLKVCREWNRIFRARGRPFHHGWQQFTRAYAKVVLKTILGESAARGLVNLTRAARGLPPYAG
jgi:glycosyltransferase involved in cell wall biosynthesis